MKTFFFFLLLTMSLSINAQITKGNWLVGGNGNFSSVTSTSFNSSGNETESKGSGMQIRPNIGYFLLNKFATGLGVNVNYVSSRGTNTTNWSIGASPFVRYYILKNDNRYNIFGEANFSYNTGLSKINNDSTSTSVGLSTGGVVFFNSSVGLELTFNYANGTSRRDGVKARESKQFFIGLGFQIHLKK